MKNGSVWLSKRYNKKIVVHRAQAKNLKKTCSLFFFSFPQSRYFEFDDSDSYSEKSFFSDEIDIFGNYYDDDDDDNNDGANDDDDIYDDYDENFFATLNNNQKCWTEKTSNSVSASLSDLSIESERDSAQT